LNAGAKSFLKIGLTGALVVASAWIIFAEFRGLMRGGDARNRVFFYDESEKKLYTMPDTTMPPDRGIGGPGGDGERAIVVGFGREKQEDQGKRRVAYLQKYSPELKKLLDESILARAAGQVFNGTIPGRQSEYFQTNTFVKRVEENDWHTANSPEGKAIVNEWRTWQDDKGNGPFVCTPD
jgi:hypothetical protein